MWNSSKYWKESTARMSLPRVSEQRCSWILGSDYTRGVLLPAVLVGSFLFCYGLCSRWGILVPFPPSFEHPFLWIVFMLILLVLDWVHPASLFSVVCPGICLVWKINTNTGVVDLSHSKWTEKSVAIQTNSITTMYYILKRVKMCYT